MSWVLDGSMVLNVSRVLDVSAVLDVSVADFWREKHGRCGSVGKRWGMIVAGRVLVRNKRKTLTEISALFESHETL